MAERRRSKESGREARPVVVDAEASEAEKVVGVLEENETEKAAEVSKLKTEVEDAYVEKSSDKSDKAKSVVGGLVGGTARIAGGGVWGAGVGFVSGAWKSTVGIAKTVGHSLFTGRGKIFDYLGLGDIRDGLVTGYEKVRERFRPKKGDKKEDK